MSHTLPSAPKPLPPKNPVKPSELRDRWARIKKKNWELECDPCWWKCQPKYDYRFSVSQYREMNDLLSTDMKDPDSVFVLKDETDLTLLEISRELRMPYEFVVWLLSERKRQDRVLAKGEDTEDELEEASVLERLEWIQRQTLNYLKKVVRSEESMAKIGPEGVLTIFDRVSRASTSIANSRGSSDTTIELISNIPLSESKKRPNYK